MKRIVSAFILAAILAAHSSANAQGTYPNKPLSIIVPTPPGGYLDKVSRELAQSLSMYLLQPIVINNRPGQNGQVAMEFVGGSPADGYTVLMFSSKMSLPPGVFKPVVPVASAVNGNDWYGMLLPAATPQEVVIKLAAAMNRVLWQPDIERRLAMHSLKPAGGTPGDLTNLIATGVGREATTAAAADNAARARQNIAAAERRPAQAEERPASSGSGFFGAMLGGLASGLLDRSAAQINSVAASTGGAGGAAMGALANANTQLARETREKIARDMGGNGAMEGVAGTAVGSALGSGSMAGAVSALSGATDNLAGAALSGSAGSGASAGSSAASGACCSSASERIADNRARGAPDGFETNNERICRERGSRAYCEAGVTERRLSLGGLERFGTPGGSGRALTAANADAAACGTLKNYDGPNDDPQFDSLCKLAYTNSCLDKATGTRTYQVQTQAVCGQLNKMLRSVNNGRAATYCSNYCK